MFASLNKRLKRLICRRQVDIINSVQGFTLLEVIVALVLFTSVGIAAFSWINTSFISIERITRVTERSEMVVNGLELLRTLNPVVQPQGELETDAFHISWQTTEHQSPVKQKYGVYSVGVYTVSAVIQPNGSQERFDFSFLQNGYQPMAGQ